MAISLVDFQFYFTYDADTQQHIFNSRIFKANKRLYKHSFKINLLGMALNLIELSNSMYSPLFTNSFKPKFS